MSVISTETQCSGGISLFLSFRPTPPYVISTVVERTILQPSCHFKPKHLIPLLLRPKHDIPLSLRPKFIYFYLVISTNSSLCHLDRSGENYNPTTLSFRPKFIYFYLVISTVARFLPSCHFDRSPVSSILSFRPKGFSPKRRNLYKKSTTISCAFFIRFRLAFF